MFCICITAGVLLYSLFPVSHGPGVTAEEKPKISDLTWQKPFTFNGASLVPSKVIEAEVRILDKRRYFFDGLSHISPVDVVIGWDEMSDERNLNYIYHDLSDRIFETKISIPPIKLEAIHKQSDLWHLIPSDPSIDNKIKSLRRGNIIEIEGTIVQIETESGLIFNSPSSLLDSQNKKGFAIWVEQLIVQ
jgi:hypothetical protein